MVGLAGRARPPLVTTTPSSNTPHDDLILPRPTLTHQSMASVPSPRLLPPSSSAHSDPIASKFPGKAPSSLSHASRLALPHSMKASLGPSRVRPGPFLCRSHKSTPADDQDDGSSVNGASSPRGWDSLVHSVVVGAAKRWDDFVNAWRNSWNTDGPSDIDALAGEQEGGKKAMEVENEEDGGNWDWERWKRHFREIEEQEKLVLDLKSQLDDAISREDYEDAAKLKLAIDRAVGNDAVGTAISIMNRAIEEERFNDAAFIRDHAGAGLIGWWSGISEDGADPYGRIVCISAEYGRYVARSYSPRQLATGRSGFPLFEVFFTRTNEEYKQQVAYLKQHENSGGSIKNSEEKLGFSNLNSYDRSKEESRLHVQDIKTGEDRDDDSSLNDGVSIIQNVLRDLIPGVKIRVLKMVSPGKMNRDAIAKVVEQIMEEEEEGSEEDASDEELESIEPEDLSAENDIEEIEMDARDSTSANDRKSEVSIKFVIGGLTPKLLADGPSTSVIRLPARLERRGNTSFSIILEEDAITYEIDGKRQASKDKAFAQKSANLISFEIAKVIPDKEKIHLKVLKDLQELISYSVNNRQNYQSLFETTLFSRIEVPSTLDPLSGLYIGSHGMYSSNVLHLKRKFGQWQDHTSDKHKILEFYEYVEATKLTGDPSVPAGQVAFRAKLGKQNQLPHKGIIPEEFGVIARYRGQGRLADPGYRNPRWVDGELVIFDGKYIRGGPAIGFVYWAPESHFLLLFNRLRLPA